MPLFKSKAIIKEGEGMQIVYKKISELKAAEYNPRKITNKQLEDLKTSLQRFEVQEPAIINTFKGRENVIISGHQRIKAATELGLVEFPCVLVSLTPPKEKELNIRMNKNTGEWDFDILKDFEIDSLKDWGFGDDELDLFGITVKEHKRGKTDDDAVPPLPETAITKQGDLYILGNHRLLCGDSTKKEDVEKLMDGEKANLCFTSPPYAEQRKEQYGGIPAEKYWEWFVSVESLIRSSLHKTGNFILNIKPHANNLQRNLYVFDLVCSMVRKSNWLFVDEFCWLRTGIPQQVVNRYKNAFEPCYWFAASSEYRWNPKGAMHKSDSVPLALGPGAGDTNAAKRQGKGGGAIQGNKIVSGKAYPSNVLNFKQNAEAIGHPAAFPVQLPLFFISCMTKEDGLIYEPFIGSGTTIIACEKLSRKCYGMEIDPIYCDVIVKRWEGFTGKKAVLQK